MPDSDKTLVGRAQRGDIEAFGELYRRHASALVAYVAAIASRRGVRGWNDAEDVVQDSFRRAWQKLRSLREPERFPAWLRSIARNVALTRPAKQLVSAEGDVELIDTAVQVEDQVADDERNFALLEAIDKLRPEYREVVFARYFRDPPPTFEDLANELETPAGTLRGNVSRALQELRIHLGSEFFTDFVADS